MDIKFCGLSRNCLSIVSSNYIQCSERQFMQIILAWFSRDPNRFGVRVLSEADLRGYQCYWQEGT